MKICENLQDFVLNNTINDPKFKELSNSIINEFETYKSGLLIGKVQSGKTTAFLNIIAKALQTNFKIIVILTGTTNSLNDQTFQRVKSAFKVDGETMIFKDEFGDHHKLTITDQSKSIKVSVSQSRVDTKTVFISKKGAETENLQYLCESEDNILIIDDESDFASLNVGKKKRSTTNFYLKDLLDNNKDNIKYLAVTATPQSNILISKDEFNSPTFIKYLTPGDKYMGADLFFRKSSEYILGVSDSDVDLINNERWGDAKSFRKALFTFAIIAAANQNKLINKENFDKNLNYFIKPSMMVNISLLTKTQNQLSDKIEDMLEITFSDKNLIRSELRKPYMQSAIYNLGIDYGDHEELLINEISKIKNDIFVYPLNSDPNSKKKIENNASVLDDKYKIYIGGHNLARGLTISDLVISYFLLDPKEKTVDTTLQRARWFGYRETWMDVLEVYISDSIYSSFKNIADVENDIWNWVDKLSKDVPFSGPSIEHLRSIYIKYNILATSRVKSKKILRLEAGMAKLWDNYSSIKHIDHEEAYGVISEFLHSTLNLKNTETPYFEEDVISIYSVINYLESKEVVSNNKILNNLLNQLRYLSNYSANKELRILNFTLKDGTLRGTGREKGYSSSNKKYAPFGRTKNKAHDEDYSLQNDKHENQLQISIVKLDNGKLNIFLSVFYKNKTARLINEMDLFVNNL